MALMYDQTRWHVTKFQPVVLLMEEILHQLICSVSHYLQVVVWDFFPSTVWRGPDIGICWSSQSGTLDRNATFGSEKRHDFSTQNITPFLFLNREICRTILQFIVVYNGCFFGRKENMPI